MRRVEQRQRVRNLVQNFTSKPTIEALSQGLAGMADIVGAPFGFLFAYDLESRTLARISAHGWHGNPEHERFDQYLAHQHDSPDPSLSGMALMIERGRRVFVKSEVVSQSVWDASEHVNDFRRPSRIEEFVAAVVRAEGQSFALGFHRELGERAFSGDEANLVELFCRELEMRSRPQLPPRLSRILRELFAGANEKEIARSLGVSAHTAHNYLQQLYRHFHAHSANELLGDANVRALVQGEAAELKKAPTLAPRLEQVWRALAEGFSEKDIARELELSPHTIHDYVKELYRKLGVHDRRELLATTALRRH